MFSFAITGKGEGVLQKSSIPFSHTKESRENGKRMRTSGDCVWEKQHIWNIPDGLKKVIAGVVTVSLLVGIGDAVSMVPLQEDMRSYAATAGETIRWSVPIRLGQMVKQESMRTYTLAEMEKHVQIETEKATEASVSHAAGRGGRTGGDSAESGHTAGDS